jgi:hypothetical protein
MMVSYYCYLVLKYTNHSTLTQDQDLACTPQIDAFLCVATANEMLNESQSPQDAKSPKDKLHTLIDAHVYCLGDSCPPPTVECKLLFNYLVFR